MDHAVNFNIVIIMMYAK